MRQGEAAGAPPRHPRARPSRASIQKDVVDAGLSNINVATHRHVQRRARARRRSSSRSSSRARKPASSAPSASRCCSIRTRCVMGSRPTGERYTLAARVTGNVNTAFPNGAPAGAAAPAGGALKESAKPLNLIVFADTDLLQDYLWVRRAELLRPARSAGHGEQRRPRRQCARQHRRQHGSHQRARPRHVHAPVRSRGCAAP